MNLTDFPCMLSFANLSDTKLVNRPKIAVLLNFIELEITGKNFTLYTIKP